VRFVRRYSADHLPFGCTHRYPYRCCSYFAIGCLGSSDYYRPRSRDPMPNLRSWRCRRIQATMIWSQVLLCADNYQNPILNGRKSSRAESSIAVGEKVLCWNGRYLGASIDRWCPILILESVDHDLPSNRQKT